ncbi:NepR family anti-sigma factor [Yoonia sp. MH D7]
MNEDKQEMRKENLIRENLKRAFDDKATEELPTDLLELLAQLRGQDEQNGSK